MLSVQLRRIVAERQRSLRLDRAVLHVETDDRLRPCVQNVGRRIGARVP